MAHINFVIPGSKEELLTEGDVYYVKNTIGPKDLVNQLKNAKISLRDEGAEFILDTFDVYYSVLHHGNSLSMDVIFKAYEDLHKATNELNKALGFILEDKESLNDELKMKYLTIIKMLLYIYGQIVLLVEQTHQSMDKGLIRARKKSTKQDENFTIDKRNVLLTLNNILGREIGLFWDPPVVEENFINLFSEVCYRFLQNPAIKAEKEVRVELFSLIGSLIRGFNHGTTFVIRMVQMIKMHEHLVHCLPEGIQLLVKNYNCKGIIHDLIREITEWQTDEKYQDSKGAKFCAQVLSAMAVLMPDLMIPEVLYLNRYLSYESAPLRNSVLTVITEVVLNVLSHDDLTEEQKESRHDFLSILMDHMEDNTAHVRSKVIQHWSRLQKETAIPLKYQNNVLEKVIDHLYDKGALVRKSAVNCVTTFLSHNLFSSNLSLKVMESELGKKQEMLNKIKTQFESLQDAKLEEISEQWNQRKKDIKAVIIDELGREKSDMEKDENELPVEQIPDLIRIYLNDGKYEEAFKLCKDASEDIEEWHEFIENCGDDQESQVNLYLVILQSVFVNVQKFREEIKAGLTEKNVNMTEDDFNKMEALENSVDFLTDYVTFLKLMDKAIAPMIDLLESVSIGDMQEAVEFFISVYQFNMDNANQGILAMLKIMQRNEQERKDQIINAFKTIYLSTDTKNMSEHTTTIVNRLISLVRTVPINNLDDLQLIISEWTAKGTLDNSVIDMLWQYFTRKVSVTDEDSLAATELLKMASFGRKTIITRNIKLVTTIAFTERGANCMLFLGSACDLLAVAGSERIDITGKNPPFKVSSSDPIFTDLLNILLPKFFKPVEYYNKALQGGIDFIYKLCDKPELVCEEIITKVVNKLVKDYQEEDEVLLDRFLIMRLCQLLGLVAVKHLEFLDETVYKELKRRSNIRDTRKEEKKNNKEGKKRGKKKSVNGNVSTMSRSNATTNDSTLNTTMNDESTLEGANAEDTDAEFILNVLENDTVCGSGGLGKLAFIVKEICEKPELYDDAMVQGAGVIALIRFMLVSSKFCSDNIQLLFTIFLRTKQADVKCTILVHLSDLLTRFPNIIEPWTPRIYSQLKDPSVMIRKATFFTLSNLILRDMIRAHSHISEMVCCLVDPDEDVRGICKTFLIQLSHKENNLYNVLPDIFSHLMEIDTVTEEQTQEIMKFLFDLMDKTKYMENLVDRFCCKFRTSEEIRQNRNIAFCLSLIQYNEKALRKLHENFPTFKHMMQDTEIYAYFKTILSGCSKQQVGKVDLKPIVAEIEQCINSVFELNEDGQLMRPPPVPKTTKKTRGRKKQPVVKKRQNSDSDEEFGDSEKENNTSNTSAIRRSNRSKRSKARIDDSDSD